MSIQDKTDLKQDHEKACRTILQFLQNHFGEGEPKNTEEVLTFLREGLDRFRSPSPSATAAAETVIDFGGLG
jgi:hypothetical protein